MNDLNDHDNDDDDNCLIMMMMIKLVMNINTVMITLTIQSKSPPRIVFVKSLFRFLTKLMKEIILLHYYHTSNLFWPKSCHFKFKKL